ncbi:MAG TPA: hypothetical protein VF832_16435, partial [Longimicrobiales bacterium]
MPETPERPDFQEMARLLEQFMGGDARTGVIGLPGGTSVNVEKEPLPGIRQRFGIEGGTADNYEAADQRPESYPADLPFLPGQPALLTVPSPGLRMVMWAKPQDWGRAAEQVEQQLANSGWVRTSEHQIPFVGASLKEFRQDELERSLFAS